MFKNTASQKWVVFAFQDEGGANPGEPVTGDAANITANLRLDGGAANAVDDAAPTELEDGYYIFDITAAESNADNIVICPESATANVNVIGVPGVVFPRENTDAALVDLVWDEVLTGATHNVVNSAGRRLRGLQDFGNYLGGIHIDTINGTAGTVVDENGTAENPVDTLADAVTLNATLNYNRFFIRPGSSITLASTHSNQEFLGENWTLDLGSQSIANTFFTGATITGIGTGSNYHMEECHVGTCTVADGDMMRCSIDGTLTLSAAATYRLSGCYSGIAGSATPTIDFGAAIGNTSVNIRHYSGGVEITNKDATGTDTMTLEGNGQLIVAASSGGAIEVRGNFAVTNTGGATITYDDNTANTAAILLDTGTTLDAAIAVIDANVDLILADTSTDGVAISAAVANEIADALLNRDMSAVADTTARSPLNALRLLRNKYSVSGSTLTVTKEDDTTSAWTSALTTDATADPVTGSDPA